MLTRCSHSSGFVVTWDYARAWTVCTKTRLVLHGSCDDIICWLSDRMLCNPSLLCHFNCTLVYVPPSGIQCGHQGELWYCVWSISNNFFSAGKLEVKDPGAGKCFSQPNLSKSLVVKIVVSKLCCWSLHAAPWLFHFTPFSICKVSASNQPIPPARLFLNQE